MQRLRITSLIAFTLALTALPAAAETVRSKIRPGQEKAYSWVADSAQSSRVTVMWNKANSDIDVFAYLLTDDEPLLAAASTGSTDGLELLEFGVIPGEEYLIVLTLFDGGTARFEANVSTAGSEGLFQGPGRRGLRELGDLNALEAADAYFSTLRPSIERYRDVKP